MKTLESQLREYGRQLDTNRLDIEDDRVQLGQIVVGHPSDSPVHGTPRRPIVAFGVAIVLVLLAGASLLISSGSDPVPVSPANSVVSRTSAVTVTTTDEAPTTSADAIALGSWSRVPHDEVVFGGEGSQMMVSVTAAGPGLVAVGGGGLHDWGHAAVWTSTDGTKWSRIPHDEALFGGTGAQTMTSVVAGGPGLVAVGWNREAPWDADAAVWTSSDGITWSRVPHDEGVFGGESYQAMSAVSVGGPGLVAVGEDRSRDVDDGDPAVWTSVDGIGWSRVPHDEEVFGEGQFTGVTSSDSGLIVVVGNVGSNDGDDAAVWTSPDGITWFRVPHDEEVFGGAGMKDVTVGGPGFVAVGWSEAGAVVWTSTDGMTWIRVAHDESVFGEATGMQTVIAGGPGVVAVGHDQSDGNRAAVWTSRDGINWSRVPDDDVFAGADGAGMEGATFVEGQSVVAVGTDGMDAAVWITPLEN